MGSVITFQMFLEALVILAGAWGLTMAGPMTDHAREAHANQAIDASVMVKTVTDCLNGDPDEYCERMDIHFCRKHAGRVSPHAKVICYHGHVGDGLIIGLANEKPVVVTGYRARSQYWVRGVLRDQCVPISVDFLEGFMRWMYPGLELVP